MAMLIICTYAPFYTPSRPQPPVYNQFFRFSHLQPTPQPKPSSPKKSKSKVKISEPQSKVSPSSVTPEDSPKPTPEPPKKDKGPMDQYYYHTVQTHDSSSTESESDPIYESNLSNSISSSSPSSLNSNNSSTHSESEYANLTSILMATKTEDPSASTITPIVEDNSSDADQQEAPTEPVPPMPPPVADHSTKPSSASWFTFDNIPRHKWLARLQEFGAGLISKELNQMHIQKVFFVNLWPAQWVLYEIG
ncbi:probable serine/threonine-protein kinase samkC [Citrus clementina]|uniref:probable serine/threonine-protein kinase samkC n=1 Tax=Citrus clementina TaxID=85681 RepID=UPI000CED37C0|nr:probable serine/threonine-protein kinase samkC [Citrus x clementina]